MVTFSVNTLLCTLFDASLLCSRRRMQIRENLLRLIAESAFGRTAATGRRARAELLRCGAAIAIRGLARHRPQQVGTGQPRSPTEWAEEMRKVMRKGKKTI